jgi:hypothetical protein
MRLSTLDLVSVVMDRAERPLDFAINLRLRTLPPPARLAAGAASARDRYPTTASVLTDDEWRVAVRSTPIEWHPVEPSLADAAAARFIDTPWDLTRVPPVQQRMFAFSNGDGGLLVTRFHHAAADGVAAGLWLRHQLAIAFGGAAPATDAAPRRPQLRHHESPTRRSAFAFPRPAERLRDARGAPTARREWERLTIESERWTSVARSLGMTYNAFLSTCLLETARLWNGGGDRHAAPAVGLWIPANIRAAAPDGGGESFGNGTSRIRIYNRYHGSAPFAEKCRSVRAQMEWSQAHGEWALPAWSTRPRRWSPVQRRLLRAYLERPWADMGTMAFSHLRRSALDDLAPDAVAGVDVIGSLDRRHALGVFAFTRRAGGDTAFAFVYDSGQLDRGRVTRLMAMFEDQLALAAREAGTT